MGQSVNLDNLRSITGGDKDLETEMFQLFLASSADCVQSMRAALESSDDTAWHSQAHALKGICFNLGATRLGDLCKQAQDDCHALPEEKLQIIAAIEHEIVEVRAFLQGCIFKGCL